MYYLLTLSKYIIVYIVHKKYLPIETICIPICMSIIEYLLLKSNSADARTQKKTSANDIKCIFMSKQEKRNQNLPLRCCSLCL